MGASTIFSKLWASTVLIWLYKKKSIPTYSGGPNAHLWSSPIPEHYLGWASAVSYGLTCVQACWRPGIWDGSLNPPSRCSKIWGSKEDPHLRFESTLIPLPDCDHRLLTGKSNSLVLLGRVLSWAFILVTNTHYAPGTFSPSLLGSEITPSGESQQKLLQLTLKLKSRLCVKLLWDRNPQCQALKDKKWKKKKTTFWASIISNFGFHMYIFAILYPPINFNSIEAEDKDVLLG